VVSERQSQEAKGLVTIRVEGLKARVAADLVDVVIQRLERQGCKVVIVDKEESA
jgi:hypothetical protein